MNDQQVKIITGVFSRGYRDPKGNTTRSDAVQAKDGPEIIKLLEGGLSHILPQFTVPSWCEEKAKLVQSLGGKIMSLDTEGNASISIDSSKLKGQRAKLEIYTGEKILNIQTAKEQMTALRSLGDEITIEYSSGNKIQVTESNSYRNSR